MRILPALRRPRVLVSVAVVALVLAGGAWWTFAPKPTTTLAEPFPEGASVVKAGEWRDGETFHQASGRAAILRLPDGSHALRLEGYDATNGPHVWFWLVPDASAASESAVEGAGSRLEVPRGFLGQATARGDFLVPIPDEVDVAAVAGVVAWCEVFDVLFGSAPLA